MIRLCYTKAGISNMLEISDDHLDALLKRCDAEFLPPWTAQDEIRFRAIMANDAKRRDKNAR